MTAVVGRRLLAQLVGGTIGTVLAVTVIRPGPPGSTPMNPPG